MFDDPFGPAQRAHGECVAAGGSVRNLEALADAAEEYGVVADNVARADDLHADLTALALPDHAFAGVSSDLVEALSGRLGQHLRDLQGSSARSVLFQPVVGFRHLDVVVVA